MASAQRSRRMEKDLSRSGPFYRVVEPTVGYTLSARGNDFYWKKVPTAGIHCPECRSALDYTAVSPGVDIGRKCDIADASLRKIVSPRFRDFCIARGFTDIEFLPVRAKWPMFEMRPTKILEVDWEASKPRFTRLCPRCGQFECILMGEGLFLKGVSSPLEEGFYRTDLIWGCSSLKAPKIIVGVRTMEHLKRAGFANMYFWPVPHVRLVRPSVPQGERGYRGE